ncbi:MAG: TIGR00730 family Rossman fold protein [Alphaproteobacteria bacterium]
MKNFNTLTVYLGSSGNARPVFKVAAEAFGRIIAQNGRRLVYGGMDAGLMGLLAVNALKAGGFVTGIIPQNLKDSERILKNLPETILVPTLWERKKLMFNAADAIIALPGGFGTADESLEMLYWGYLGLHNKPLVLVNIEQYWDAMISYLRGLPDYDARFLIVVERVEDVIPALDGYTKMPAVAEQTTFPHFEDEILRQTGEPILIDKANIQNSYYAICALGLKQLGKHERGIGFLNEGSQFDALLAWFQKAHTEKFITDKCLQLFTFDTDREKLMHLLKTQISPHIDLHGEKWGERREKPRT